MTLATEYKKQLVESYAFALRKVVAANPNITAKGIRSLMNDYPELADVRLEQILDGVGKGKGKPAAKPKAAAAAAAAAPKRASKGGGGGSKRWNVRSPEGRAALSAAVLEALSDLGGKEVAAQAIRKKLGATPAQIRTTLNRHIEAGAVTFSGKARGTRYTLP